MFFTLVYYRPIHGPYIMWLYGYRHYAWSLAVLSVVSQAPAAVLGSAFVSSAPST